MTSALNEDRLLPADPGQRSIARRLYEAIKDRPIISPHGHVPIDWFARINISRIPPTCLSHRIIM